MRHPIHPGEPDAKLPMTSMIDVTFLLLVFFLFAFRFPTLEGRVDSHLPATEETSGGPIEKVEVLIEVVRPGRKMDPFEEGKPWSGQPGTRFAFDDSRVIEYWIGPRRTKDLAVLQDRLQQLRRAGHSFMSIDARKGIVYDEVVGVIDAALSAGYEEVGIVQSYE